MRDNSMVTCTRCSSDDRDTEAIRPSQWKMKKRQRTGIRPMAVGTQHANFGLRVETKLYLKRARKMGNSLITSSTQRTNSDLMAVSQRMVKPRVVAEQQTNTCP